MKFTISWLKEHLDTEADVHQITEALTDLGLEVDAIVFRHPVLSVIVNS